MRSQTAVRDPKVPPLQHLPPARGDDKETGPSGDTHKAHSSSMCDMTPRGVRGSHDKSERPSSSVCCEGEPVGLARGLSQTTVPGCVTLGRSWNLSELQLPLCRMGCIMPSPRTAVDPAVCSV